MFYYVPNFCINDPFFEREIRPDNKENETGKQLKVIYTVNIQIIMYDIYENTKTPVMVSETSTGKQLKDIYSKIINVNLEQYKLRFLFGGTEIQEDHKLHQYNLQDDYLIQVLKKLNE